MYTIDTINYNLEVGLLGCPPSHYYWNEYQDLAGKQKSEKSSERNERF